MRLSLKSSGGVGGFRQRVEGHLETDGVPWLEKRIAELRQSGELGTSAIQPPRFPDAQQIVIELQSGHRETLVVDESTASDGVLQLIDDIREHMAADPPAE